jgi:UDP-N-acetylmuramoyl-tripeptide--D-alanyl-D-alanine ligase
MIQDIPYQVLYFVGFLWFLVVFRNSLFYLYLWQLKEYHTGRFLDHFNTAKGRSLILNPFNYLRIFIIAIYFPAPLLTFFASFLLYFFGAIKAVLDFTTFRFKRPVFTKKALFLIFAAFSAQFLFLFFAVKFSQGAVCLFAFLLILFDFLTPVIISAVVLLLQPLAVLGRNRIVNAARQKREAFKNLLVIGITGSYGKTSTKEFLYTILSSKWGDKVLKTNAHQNSEVGISRCILNDLKPGHEIFIVEMGAYNRGGIKLLCSIVKPKVGILTGINEQHMATFGSQENIIKGKYELIESLPKDGIAFFNGKNKYCVQLFNKTSGIRRFLYGDQAQFFGEENIYGAMAVARELGMTPEEIKAAADKIPNRMPGIQAKKGINGLNIIDATYSANPDGAIANLDYLRNFPGKKIIVMPCLIELGKASKDVHRRIGKKIAEMCDLGIITTMDRFKEIKEGEKEAEILPSQKSEIIFMENPKEIFEKIKIFTKEGDVVLLESRVPKKLIKLLGI